MNKKRQATAKLMLKQSLTDGLVDARKVRAVLAKVALEKPAGLIKILKTYKGLVEMALKREEVVVEAATILSGQKQLEKELSEKFGIKRIDFKINPQMIFGAKIIHGDWIYEATMEGKLRQLTLLR